MAEVEAPEHLTLHQERVARMVVRLSNQSAAARALGMKDRQAVQAICALPKVEAFMAALRTERAREFEAESAMVIRELARIAGHEPSKVFQVRQTTCGLCYDRARQAWHKAQRAAQKKARREGKKWKAKTAPWYPEAPDPDCERCRGDGSRTVWMADSRDLGVAEATAIQSVKHGENGLEVKLADKVAALAQLAKILGLYDDKDKAPAEPFTLMINGVQIDAPQPKDPP